LQNPSEVGVAAVPESAIAKEAVLSLLKEASRSIEGLWRVTFIDRDAGEGTGLCEASRSLHQALIALEATP
jgi:hypothetical protein